MIMKQKKRTKTHHGPTSHTKVSHSKMIRHVFFCCFVKKHILDGSLVWACSHSQGSGSHVDFCPRPWSSTCRWARFSTHRHNGPHSVCNPCSRAHFGHVTAACVIAKETGQFPEARTCSRTWTFPRRLHILGAPLSLSFTVHLRKPRYKKLAIAFPETWLSFVIVTTRVFRPAGRILHSDHQT